jgi:hypothetical protein
VDVKSKIIKKLGGFTEEEVNNLKLTYTKESEELDQSLQSWRDRAITAEAILRDKDSQIENLTEQMKAITYALNNRPESQESKHFDPIATVPLSWPRARRELERKDRSESLKEKSNARVP